MLTRLVIIVNSKQLALEDGQVLFNIASDFETKIWFPILSFLKKWNRDLFQGKVLYMWLISVITVYIVCGKFLSREKSKTCLLETEACLIQLHVDYLCKGSI